MSGDFSEIPIVDLAPWWGDDAQRQLLADQVREICHQVGFFVVINHGIPKAFTDSIFALMDEFFALPAEDKALIDKVNSPHFRGWEKVGSEYTNNRPDYREQIDLWSEHAARPTGGGPSYWRLLGPNQRFPDHVLPEFGSKLDEWFERMDALAGELMSLLSMSLGLEPDHIDNLFGDERMNLTKLISYPPTPAGGAGVNAHHDTGFVTILAPGQTPGLQVQNEAGDWIDVPIVADSFVINLGELLQAITGNYFVATPHRVITAEPRKSAGYFAGPALDVAIDLLPLEPSFAEAVAASPRHRGAGFMASAAETNAGVAPMSSSYKPAVFGEQLWNYFSRSYPENMARHHADI